MLLIEQFLVFNLAEMRWVFFIFSNLCGEGGVFGWAFLNFICWWCVDFLHHEGILADAGIFSMGVVAIFERVLVWEFNL